MKRVLFGVIGLFTLGSALSAVASDLPTKAPPLVTETNWTGCYIGVEGGGNWGRTNSIATGDPDPTVAGLPLTGNYTVKGGAAGGTIGCNYQAGIWVYGLENDISWTDQKGTANDLAPFPIAATNQYSANWIDTLRGRVGFAVDRALLYGTAGAAFAGTSDTICFTTCTSNSKNRSGFAVGGGVEYAAWTNVSVKFEYLHVDFGSKNYVDPSRDNTNTRGVNLTDDMFRAGVNWRFYAAPVDLAKN